MKYLICRFGLAALGVTLLTAFPNLAHAGAVPVLTADGINLGFTLNTLFRDSQRAMATASMFSALLLTAMGTSS